MSKQYSSPAAGIFNSYILANVSFGLEQVSRYAAAFHSDAYCI